MFLSLPQLKWISHSFGRQHFKNFTMQQLVVNEEYVKWMRCIFGNSLFPNRKNDEATWFVVGGKHVGILGHAHLPRYYIAWHLKRGKGWMVTTKLVAMKCWIHPLLKFNSDFVHWSGPHQIQRIFLTSTTNNMVTWSALSISSCGISLYSVVQLVTQ